MRTTLKVAVSIVVAGALVFSGIALAQTDDEAEETPVEDRPAYARILDVLEPLVDEGTISGLEAEAVAATLVEAMPERPDRCPGHRVRIIGRQTADFLGITVEEVRDAVGDGATLAEVAEQNGSSAEELIDHLVGLAEGRLDDALDRITDRITGLVNGDLPSDDA
jgi:hypothetical protein